MPSVTESYILLAVLGIILASLPVAMLLWRRRPVVQEGEVIPPAPSFSSPPVPVPQPLSGPAPPPLPEWYNPWQPPATELLPPAPQPAPGWSRMDAWFAFALVLVISVLLGPVSSLLVAMTGKEPEAIKIEYTASLFLTQIIFQAVMIALVLVWVCAVRKFNPVQIFGLKERGPLMTPALALAWLVGAYVVLLLVSAAVLPLMQKLTGMDLKQQGLVESAPDIKSGVTRVLMVVTLCLGAPLMEEVIFRGVIFGVASRFFHPVYATAASSLLFGVIHNNLLSLIPLTVLGVCLAEAYRRTRTLAVPILMHAAFNGVTFLILMYGPPELRNM